MGNGGDGNCGEGEALNVVEKRGGTRKAMVKIGYDGGVRAKEEEGQKLAMR